MDSIQRLAPRDFCRGAGRTVVHGDHLVAFSSTRHRYRLALSYIFLSHQRDELSRDIAARLNRKKTDVDAESEDAVELPREGNTKK